MFYNLLVLSSLSRTEKLEKNLHRSHREQKSHLYSQMMVKMSLRKNVFSRVTAANIQIIFNHTQYNQIVIKRENAFYFLCIQVLMFIYAY